MKPIVLSHHILLFRLNTMLKSSCVYLGGNCTLKGKPFSSQASSSIRAAVYGHSHYVTRQPLSADVNNGSPCLDQAVDANMSRPGFILNPNTSLIFCLILPALLFYFIITDIVIILSLLLLVLLLLL